MFQTGQFTAFFSKNHKNAEKPVDLTSLWVTWFSSISYSKESFHPNIKFFAFYAFGCKFIKLALTA